MSLSLSGDIAKNYKRWKQCFELYFLASDAERKLNDETKVALLLLTIGEKLFKYSVYLNLPSINRKQYIYSLFSEFSIHNENVDILHVSVKSKFHSGGCSRLNEFVVYSPSSIVFYLESHTTHNRVPIIIYMSEDSR